MERQWGGEPDSESAGKHGGGLVFILPRRATDSRAGRSSRFAR
jgi:hypothetical protein